MRNVLDIFAGAAGGWSLGMHRAGYETIAACEIDPWRREQYRKNNPTVRIYDDVRTLTADRLHDDGLFPDIVVGSPPCQDISSANHNGKGVWLVFADTSRQQMGRAGQSRQEAARVPANTERCTLWEQSRGCRGTDGSGQNIAVADGADADCQGQHAGTEDAAAVAWSACSCGNASDPSSTESVGRNSHRRRQRRTEETSGSGHLADTDETRPAIGQGVGCNNGAECPSFERNAVSFRHHWAASAPDFGQLDDGFPSAVARACISAYGDAVVPQIPEIIGNAMRRVFFGRM